MATDDGPLQVRARAWVTVVDHTVEPPVPVEEIFIENGTVMERRALLPTLGAQAQGDSDAATENGS